MIINLKTIVVVAEIKCIKYPMEIRDYYNNYERLKKGAEQINRKAAFFTCNTDEVKSIIGSTEGKKVVKLLITNYPIFAGSLIEHIPIVDFHWLDSFCKYNYLIGYQASAMEGKLRSEVEQAEILYHNEDEFNAVFESQMRNPAIIEALKPSVDIKESRMSLTDFPIELYQELAYFK